VWDPFRKITGEEMSPYENFRDVVYIGKCDDGVKELADILGWTSDLQNISK